MYDPLWEVDWSYDVERERLAAAGVDLELPRDEDAARDAIREADVVIVSYRKFGAEQIASLERCVGIVCYSVGMDAVDQDAAAAAGLAVRNVPDYCTDEVSDHALALVLAAERRLVPIANRAAAGEWDAWDATRPLHRLRGQTLGIVGAGRIGRRVAEKARAFGFRTVAVDPRDEVFEGQSGLERVALPDLLAMSDVVVLCAALTDSSRHLIDAAAFTAMKPGVILVNVARGALIDEPALADAIRSGRVRTAALDVRSPEPPDPANDPLAGLPAEQLIQTPHIAAASQEATRDLQAIAADACVSLLADAGRVAGRA